VFKYLKGTSESGTQVDLTNCTGTWTITWTDGSVAYTNDDSVDGTGVFFPNPPQGFINLTLSADATTEIPWTFATYTFDLIDPVNGEYRLLDGGIGIT
jgi:hypothetical protein